MLLYARCCTQEVIKKLRLIVSVRLTTNPLSLYSIECEKSEEPQ